MQIFGATKCQLQFDNVGVISWELHILLKTRFILDGGKISVINRGMIHEIPITIA